MISLHRPEKTDEQLAVLARAGRTRIAMDAQAEIARRVRERLERAVRS